MAPGFSGTGTLTLSRRRAHRGVVGGNMIECGIVVYVPISGRV